MLGPGGQVRLAVEKEEGRGAVVDERGDALHDVVGHGGARKAGEDDHVEGRQVVRKGALQKRPVGGRDAGRDLRVGGSLVNATEGAHVGSGRRAEEEHLPLAFENP